MRALPGLDKQRTAYKEAQRRTAAAISAQATDLDFSDLEDLVELPTNISEAKSVRNLDLEDTCISDLTPLVGLNIYSLDLDNTNVIDLSPIAGMNQMYSLYFSRTLVDNIEPVKSLGSLSSIRMIGTGVSDLSPLVGLENLRYLYADRTKVTDLSPLRHLKRLATLHIASTGVVDLSALAGQKTLSELDISKTRVSDLRPIRGALQLFNPVRNSGIIFHECENLPEEIRELASRKNPGRSLEVGRLLGVRAAQAEPDAEDDFLDTIHLTQRPAPYSFEWIEGKLDARAQVQGPFDPELASDIISSVLEKLRLCRASMSGNESDHRVESAIDDAIEELNRPVSEIRDGLLLMRLRTLQAVSATYFDGSNEQHGRIRSMVIDAALSLEDALALYPGARTIDANRQALGFQANDDQIESYVKLSAEIIQAAAHSPIVGQSTVDALKEGSKEIVLLTDIIANTANERTKAEAIERRASIASLQMLGTRNFVTAPIRKFVEEMGPVASESWTQIKAAIPLGVGDGVRSIVSGSIRAGAGALATALAGPVAGLAVFAASFVPLARAANSVAEIEKDEAADDDEK